MDEFTPPMQDPPVEGAPLSSTSNLNEGGPMVPTEMPTADKMQNGQFAERIVSNEKNDLGPKDPADFSGPDVAPPPDDGSTPPTLESAGEHGAANPDPLVDKDAQEAGAYTLDMVGVELQQGEAQIGKVSGPQ